MVEIVMLFIIYRLSRYEITFKVKLIFTSEV
jgi:hypothetical protein